MRVIKYLSLLVVALVGMTQADESPWERAEIILKSDDQIEDQVSS